MDKKTLTDLDFYRIRDEISGFCVSEEGNYAFSRIEPLTDYQKIEEQKNFSREWTKFLSTTRPQPVSFWPPVFEIFRIIKTPGAQISLEQAFNLWKFTGAVKKAFTAIHNACDELDLENLNNLIKDVSALEEPSSLISRIVDENGELKDLPEIRALRNKIIALNAKIREIMRSFTSDQRFTDVLESTVPVLKAGRQVLAVKSSRRNQIPGIIHEVSQTGLTVFIEPEECVKCSNDLIQLEFELEQEVRKILLELTENLRLYKSDFSKTMSVMKILDCTFAAAQWGKQNNAFFAETINIEENEKADGAEDENPKEKKALTLLKARHPLLGEKAVPIDVKFLPGKNVLIITGPNTGGKTVTLKTIALFAMLNQSGFPVPASEGTCLPVFTKIFADIGDEQSLDASLSTFSGHMKNIAKAVRYADSSSLVLLDELGSGTDPQEGAAISMAVLDLLISKKASVLITTHQGVIKNYGYTHDQCINASVDFNPDTLSPTYKILMGVPGESHALDIALSSGLPKDIVQKARNYIATEKTNVSSLIRGLSQKHQQVQLLEEDLIKKQQELDEQIYKTEKKALSLHEKELALKNEAHTESHEFLIEARKNLENLVRILKEGEITREKTLGVKKFISDLTDKIEENEKALEEEEINLAEEQMKVKKLSEKVPVSHKKTKKRMKNSDALKTATPMQFTSEGKSSEPLIFKTGANVIAGISNQKGTLLSEEKPGVWLVQFGSLKMTVKQKDLTLIADEGKSVNTPGYSVEYASENSINEEKPVFELRLLGMREAEAIKALQRQLELCAMTGFKAFSVIHGKGNGILQTAVHTHLSHSPVVKSFTFAPPEDGGTGKTYVTMNT